MVAGFAVVGEVQALDFVVGGGAQADDGLDDVGADGGADDGEGDGQADGLELLDPQRACPRCP